MSSSKKWLIDETMLGEHAHIHPYLDLGFITPKWDQWWFRMGLTVGWIWPIKKFEHYKFSLLFQHFILKGQKKVIVCVKMYLVNSRSLLDYGKNKISLCYDVGECICLQANCCICTIIVFRKWYKSIWSQNKKQIHENMVSNFSINRNLIKWINYNYFLMVCNGMNKL